MSTPSENTKTTPHVTADVGIGAGIATGTGNHVDASRTVIINIVFTGRVPRTIRRMLREVLDEADSALARWKGVAYPRKHKGKT